MRNRSARDARRIFSRRVLLATRSLTRQSRAFGWIGDGRVVHTPVSAPGVAPTIGYRRRTGLAYRRRLGSGRRIAAAVSMLSWLSTSTRAPRRWSIDGGADRPSLRRRCNACAVFAQSGILDYYRRFAKPWSAGTRRSKNLIVRCRRGQYPTRRRPKPRRVDLSDAESAKDATLFVEQRPKQTSNTGSSATSTRSPPHA